MNHVVHIVGTMPFRLNDRPTMFIFFGFAVLATALLPKKERLRRTCARADRVIHQNIKLLAPSVARPRPLLNTRHRHASHARHLSSKCSSFCHHIHHSVLVKEVLVDNNDPSPVLTLVFYRVICKSDLLYTGSS